MGKKEEESVVESRTVNCNLDAYLYEKLSHGQREPRSRSSYWT